jgi:polysaccharide pyruvyl transferase WcaK-like protein
MIKGSSKVLMIDAFSTLHVGNGALIDNTYKLCKQYLGEHVEILSIDAGTNKERFPIVLDDIFTGYGGSFLNKLSYALAITFFVMIECLNTVAFRGRVRLPWKRRYRIMLEALDRADICVSLSGETINDHYRPHMYLRLLTYYLAVLKGKKFIVFPQSIGPIFRPLSKWLLRKTLGNAHAIIARDKESFALAKELWEGCKVEVSFSPDVATTQESTVKPLPVNNKEKKVVGLTVSDIPKDEMGYQGDYLRDLLDGIAKALSKDTHQILMMPSNYRHNELSQDYRVCLEAKEILQEKGFDVTIMNNEIVHPDVYQGMQRSLLVFISTRMHVGILATSASVPTLMINTQHKIRSYMSLMEMEDYVLELDSLTEVTEKVAGLLNQNMTLRETLFANNKKLRDQVKDAMLNLSKSL